MFGSPRDFQCDKCNAMVANEHHLLYHLCGEYPTNWTSNEDTNMKECKACGKVLKSFESFLHHYAIQHEFHNGIKRTFWK